MKKIFTFIALAFSFSIATAQTAPAKQWDVRFGGGDVDDLRALQQTSDGGYILGGWTYSGSNGDVTQSTRGSADYWIVKTDSNGIKQWDARFGGSSNDYLRTLHQTSDGGYILGGYSTSGISGDKTQASQGGIDYWIVKTDGNGVKQWDARFGGSDDDYLFSLQQTSDGGYILGGQSGSGISGDKTQASQGDYDFWIVKTDGNGVKQWDTRFGGTYTESLSSLQQTSDGGYIFGGPSSSPISGDKTQASQGYTDYWIVKTDGNGVKQWDKRFGGSDDDPLSSLQQTSDGGYILGGLSFSGIGGDKTQSGRGYGDYWIVKTDGSGIKQWDARFGGNKDDFLYSVRQTSDGGYILGGYSASDKTGDKTQGNRGDELTSDYWMVKTDSNGAKQWDARFGGSDQDLCYALQQTSDGGYILGGQSSSGIGGDKTQASRGGEDYWMVKVWRENSCITPTATITPLGNTDICETGSVKLQASGGDGYIYQWNRNQQDIPGATNQIYKAKKTGNYRVKISTVPYCSAVSKKTVVYSSCKFGEEPGITSSLNVFPNPANGNFTLVLKLDDEETSPAQVQMVNMLGQIVYDKTFQVMNGELRQQIQLSDIAATGIYLVKVIINHKVFTTQVDLQK